MSVTVASRADLLPEQGRSARFVGEDHGAEVSFFWVDAPPGAGPEFHWHPYTETWIVLEGEVRIETEETTLSAKKGDIVTVPPHTVHRFRNSGESNLEMVCIHASPTIIQTFVT